MFAATWPSPTGCGESPWRWPVNRSEPFGCASPGATAGAGQGGRSNTNTAPAHTTRRPGEWCLGRRSEPAGSGSACFADLRRHRVRRLVRRGPIVIAAISRARPCSPASSQRSVGYAGAHQPVRGAQSGMPVFTSQFEAISRARRCSPASSRRSVGHAGVHQPVRGDQSGTPVSGVPRGLETSAVQVIDCWLGVPGAVCAGSVTAHFSTPSGRRSLR